MSDQGTFINLCLEGKVLLDEIDDFIDQWHETPQGRELHDYLGMTQEEYSLWLRVPDSLPCIIKARHEMQPLKDMVEHVCQDLRCTGQPIDQSRINQLQKWLKVRRKI